MSNEQARQLLDLVRSGSKTATQSEITEALVVCGDICSLLSPLAEVCDE